ncbi:N-acetyltransferase [Gemmatirosa kalamazoonensis]|uniref:N-acetyltransferase n=1 Tax=Gemmatirosa kalamazoonensis TaxID=861299 RepID=W0RCH2_9BACT|nr:arylamine N-acetyltransferase [Gemmatirosa kalamazoonensis]AHG88491.1 N-acetyltransferase [Gemmatirosa kalamazoonensis]
MDTPFDLDAYLARIGHAGDRAPTLDTLRAVHLAHAQTIPFETLDPLLRRPVPLDADALQAKLVRGGRGGWCFEHNHLLLHALRALGFRVTPLVGRVLWNASVSVGGVTSRSHMLLLVHLREGDHIADVGFGGLTLTAPLRLVPDVEQPTPHETFRLVPIEDGRELALQARVAGEWRPLYRFDLQPQHQLDYEMSSWYLCTNPRSSFLSNLLAGRPEPGGRRVLRNNVLTTHRLGAPSESRTLTTAAEIRDTLERTFGIALPDSPDLEPTLERIAATPPPPP